MSTATATVAVTLSVMFATVAAEAERRCKAKDLTEQLFAITFVSFE
jgi:hypothetical protein